MVDLRGRQRFTLLVNVTASSCFFRLLSTLLLTIRLTAIAAYHRYRLQNIRFQHEPVLLPWTAALRQAAAEPRPPGVPLRSAKACCSMSSTSDTQLSRANGERCLPSSSDSQLSRDNGERSKAAHANRRPGGTDLPLSRRQAGGA